MASKPILTYLDAGVFILGVRGTPDEKLRVNALITDPRRALVGSDYLVLEVLPKPVYFNRRAERKFYEDYCPSSGRVKTLAFRRRLSARLSR